MFAGQAAGRTDQLPTGEADTRFGEDLRAMANHPHPGGPSHRARVPASTLGNWENDRGFPDVAAGVRLAGALGVPVERLAEGVEDPAGDEEQPSR